MKPTLERPGEHHRPISLVAVAVVTVDQRHTDLSDVGTHDVPAMAGAVEPGVNHRINAVLTSRDILGNRVPAVSGIGDTSARITTISTLVRKRIVTLHPATVKQRSLFDLRVPGQSRLGGHRGRAAKSLAGPRNVNAFKCLVDKRLACDRSRLRGRTGAATAARIGRCIFLQIAGAAGRRSRVTSATASCFTGVFAATTTGRHSCRDEQSQRVGNESVEWAVGGRGTGRHHANSGRGWITRHDKQGSSRWGHHMQFVRTEGQCAATGGALYGLLVKLVTMTGGGVQ